MQFSQAPLDAMPFGIGRGFRVIVPEDDAESIAFGMAGSARRFLLIGEANQF
jgi:hypothetical protein